LRILTLFVGSWLAGLAAYIGVLALFYGQAMSRGDFFAVCFWSLLAFAAAFFGFYLPALLGVRRLLGGVRPVWPFPVAAGLLGIVPTAAILFLWGGNVRSLLSPEAFLFCSMFATAGVVVGLSFVLVYRPDRTA
jgi:hypothetical protein